jgi:hypothetical protein
VDFLINATFFVLGMAAGGALAAGSLVRIWSPMRTKYLREKERLQAAKERRYQARVLENRAASTSSPGRRQALMQQANLLRADPDPFSET